MEPRSIHSAFLNAIAAAEATRGRTAPNPPVAAALLDHEGALLALGVHQGAGTPHAEIAAFRQAEEAGVLEAAHTLLVTLEPCNHSGRTPPCTDAILRRRIEQVLYGTTDPNPNVAGQGAARLEAAGIPARIYQPLQARCESLIRPFRTWATEQRPYVTVKQALSADGSMIPPQGQKTFTSQDSLVLAHELRKRADATLTGSGTVLADDPRFTVRHVTDHPGKMRHLVVLDRKRQVPRSWIHARSQDGFQVHLENDLQRSLNLLAELGCHEVLIEAGPTLLESVKQSRTWDEWVEIRQTSVDHPDQVTRRFQHAPR